MKTLLLLALPALAGCGTLADVGDAPPSPRVFGGVRKDLSQIGIGIPCHGNCFQPFLAVFDLPLSAALDLVLLPVTGVLACTRAKEVE